ncbi:cutinase family protein [Rhodococcoides fascians]|uniref:cutinase family protein n=1 Tax=Rhodococcoides fascians TaxID=1828 RepID=UPI000690FCEA|nr:cutinase family protein [Rhodococcus fascians]
MARIRALSAAVLLAAVFGIFAAAPAGAQGLGCASTIVVAVDGTSSVGLEHTVVTAHTDIAAANGADVRRIDYPGSIWPLGPYTFDQSVQMGVDATRAELAKIAAECPDSDVELIGHSQGATVVGDTLEQMTADGLDTSAYRAVLLSDSRNPAGIGARVPGIFPGYTMRGIRGDTGGVELVQVCRPRDPICDWPTVEELDRFVTLGADFAAHHTDYPPGYLDTVPPPAHGPVLPAVDVPELPALPPLPNLTEPYTPRPLGLYLPEWLRSALPAAVVDWVPPALPRP